MFCDNCGQQNPDSARFCTGCGRAMDGSAPAPMMFAAEVGNRLRGAVEKNELLTVYTAAFYMGVHSLFALFLGIITSLGAFGGSFASASLGGFGGDKVVMAGIGGLILSLFGAYGLAIARGLFTRQSWAGKSAILASILWAILEFVVIFVAPQISGPILLLTVLRAAVWAGIGACLMQPSVKNILRVD
ncbi:zinc ribbon domain-containing protein [Thermomonas sp.]|uniref:zinc ribbon domain-containing protein n=1 Tax=Thermomonas sp. TaxID=1971895 RepID=UPI001B7575CB|nr:zinc ribbon domain-containing protein [Thermomonas sp.]MBL0228978.1 zinc ribbon domain-containing protein [Thermomonas sp.]MBP8647669.1 zinc ribbon domain-containing protein [Thermomonas sp.]